jgi:Cu(I)/Ag(I) efflux system periplasmic protein CusF
MKSINLALVVVALAMTVGMGARAQAPAPSKAAAQASAPTEFTEGEVRKVDKEAKKITLKHGEIKNLGMPAMAMAFQVNDPSVLDKFKAGDKVRFKATHDAGRYVVTEIQAVK